MIELKKMDEKKSFAIQCIDKSVVNQICSGQVILNLATAVKELVENSVDAEATTVQIKLLEYGAKMIEVSDNGHGVEESNFQALTLKHYTSKISDFADVCNVETFGFRGEALSSLCTLSKVSIITRHKDSLSATKLNFDHNGIITNSSKTARKIGTTVILEDIFYNLPVRHKEFIRNIKKEFTKMCNVLYAYSLLSRKVSISCTNQLADKKVTVVETVGGTLKSNITQIFGAKQSENLLEIKTHIPDNNDNEDHPAEGSCKKLKSENEIKLEGFISSCTHGCGRSSTDRQFYYVNSRPVDNCKVMKLVNDVYHQYNPHQYPFVVLNMIILMECIDINVTPDKRMIFVKSEKLLLSIIESSLHAIFQNKPRVLEMQNVGIAPSPALRSSEYDIKENYESIGGRITRFRCSTSLSRDAELKVNKNSKTADRELRKSRNASSTGNISTINKFFRKIEKPVSNREDISIDRNTDNEELVSNGKVVSEVAHLRDNDSKNIKSTEDAAEMEESYNANASCTNIDEIKSFSNTVEEREYITVDNKRKLVPESADNLQRPEKVFIQETENNSIKKMQQIDDGTEENYKENRKTLMLDIRLDAIKDRLSAIKKNRSNNLNNVDDNVRFYSAIDPQNNENAEQELKRELASESFKHMNIIGQFNLGFIIVSLGKDIFIVDQHASDEKYNFETLQLTTKLQIQKLVVPQKLNLTVEKEEMFLHHGDIIRKNGFEFTFDADERPTNRIKLTSIPLSKNWIFGKEDIEELLYMLENAPDEKTCRPSRIRNMFASRACRKSVMIGTALSHSEMKRIVEHMGEIEQPWNCPHGRPTIRHLVNLNLIRKSN